MTLIIEDGSGVEGAQSYVTGQELIDYAALYGYEIPDEATAEIMILNGMDYFETRDLKGTKKSPTQSLHYPATNLYLYGQLVPDNVVPELAKKALKEIGLSNFNGQNPLAVTKRGIKQKTVGPITTIYDDADTTIDVGVNPKIDLYMAELVNSVDSEGVIKLSFGSKCCCGCGYREENCNGGGC